jgi:hypothetical protein
MKALVAVIAIALFTQPMFGKNRNPDDYPQRAKVLSFARQQGKNSATSRTATSTSADCNTTPKMFTSWNLRSKDSITQCRVGTVTHWCFFSLLTPCWARRIRRISPCRGNCVKPSPVRSTKPAFRWQRW